MTAGRPPIPLETKKLRGTDRPDRRGPKIMGQFSVPRKPRNLPKEAIPYWYYLVPMLARRGILTETDVPALAHLCLVMARLYAAEAMMSKGMLVPKKNEAGDVIEIVRNPASMLVNQYAHQWLVYCGRFALTPSDRAGITIEAPQELSLAESLNEMVKSAVKVG